MEDIKMLYTKKNRKRNLKEDPRIEGFGIFELVFVLVVSSVIAFVVISFWPSSLNVNTQAKELASDFLYTQSLSMTTGQVHHLKFLSPTEYEIRDMSVIPTVQIKKVTLHSGVFWTFTGLAILIAYDEEGVPYINDTNLPLNPVPYNLVGRGAYFQVSDASGNNATVIIPPSGVPIIYDGNWECYFGGTPTHPCCGSTWCQVPVK